MTQEEPHARPVTLRPRAAEDIERHADYLEDNAAPEIAVRFRIALMQAVSQIALLPHSGAPRAVRNSALSGLRTALLPDLRNYLLFYLTPDDTVEIVRVLHGAQDIASILEDEGAAS